MKGYALLEDYYNFFENFYSEELPIATEDIEYLFKRHDKEKIGRVTEASFLKELMPLEDYIVIDWNILIINFIYNLYINYI